MSHLDEHQMICRLIQQPAGYSVDLFGILTLRSLEDGRWAVSYDPPEQTGMQPWESIHGQPEDAVTKFLEARKELKLGADHEGSS